MIAQSIRLVLSNLPLLLCLAAVICPALWNNGTPWPRRYLSWLLLMAVGIDGLWAGVFHIFFPGIASAQIGWQPSPFEFEVGVADTALGVVAVIAFWCSLSFQSAVAIYAIIFYGGVAIGHFIQAFAEGNYAADNFGLLLVLTIARAIALAALLWGAWQHVGLTESRSGQNARS